MNENEVLDSILEYHLLIHTHPKNKNLIKKFSKIVKYYDSKIEDWRIEHLRKILFEAGFLKYDDYGNGDEPCKITTQGIKAAEIKYYSKPEGLRLAVGSHLNDDEKYEAAEEIMFKIIPCLPKHREFEVLEISQNCRQLSVIEKHLIADIQLELSELLVKNQYAYYSRDDSNYYLKNTGKDLILETGTKQNVDPKTSKIFISHSSKDEPIITKFIDKVLICALGLNQALIFYSSLDGMGVKSGEDFKITIKTELLQSKMVLQFLSESYKKSEVCLNEMGAAWVLCDKVIPFVFSNNVDVGFIHASNHQVRLNLKQSLLQFIDDYKDDFPMRAGLSEIHRQVDEFVQLL